MAASPLAIPGTEIWPGLSSQAHLNWGAEIPLQSAERWSILAQCPTYQHPHQLWGQLRHWCINDFIWAEHFSLGFRLQNSTPMSGGVSLMERTKGSPGAPSPLVPTFSHPPVVWRLPAHPQTQCTSTAGSENILQTCRCNGISSTWAGTQGGSQAPGFLWTVPMLLTGRRQHERGGSEGSPAGRQEFSEMLLHSP